MIFLFFAGRSKGHERSDQTPSFQFAICHNEAAKVLEESKAKTQSHSLLKNHQAVKTPFFSLSCVPYVQNEIKLHQKATTIFFPQGILGFLEIFSKTIFFWMEFRQKMVRSLPNLLELAVGIRYFEISFDHQSS